MPGEPERRSPSWWASRPARSASGSASSATRGWSELCTLHYQGDPGRLRPAQVQRLKQEIEKGVFHNAEQIRTWVQETVGVAYSIETVARKVCYSRPLRALCRTSEIA